MITKINTATGITGVTVTINYQELILLAEAKDVLIAANERNNKIASPTLKDLIVFLEKIVADTQSLSKARIDMFTHPVPPSKPLVKIKHDKPW